MSYSNFVRPIPILGGGLAGLSAAYHLNNAYRIFESERQIGGVARSETLHGFTFDHAIHILFSSDPYAKGLIKLLLGDNFEVRQRSSWIYSANVYTHYPYQAHLFGLPDSIIRENLDGLLDARSAKTKDPQNFEEWILATFGKGIAKNFMLPFNRKVWACEPSEMSFDWIKDRVMMPRLEDVLSGSLQPKRIEFGPNAEFWYPCHGGTMALANGFRKHLSPIETAAECQLIDLESRKIAISTGELLEFDRLISTLPLPALLNRINSVPSRIKEAVSQLRFNQVLTINLGIARSNITDKHWIYFPDESIPFHRVSFPANFSKSSVPPGMSSIMIEISESDLRRIDRTTVVEHSISALRQVGILRNDDRIVLTKLIDIDPAYVIYDHNHRRCTSEIQNYLRSVGIYSCGRFGEWEYLNMDQAILSGKKIAEELNSQIL